jgi:hypothetical protein
MLHFCGAKIWVFKNEVKTILKDDNNTFLKAKNYNLYLKSLIYSFLNYSYLPKFVVSI